MCVCVYTHVFLNVTDSVYVMFLVCVFSRLTIGHSKTNLCALFLRKTSTSTPNFSVACSSMCSVKTSWALHCSLGMSIVVIDVLFSFRQSYWFSPMILMGIAYSLVGDTISQKFFLIHLLFYDVP